MGAWAFWTGFWEALWVGKVAEPERQAGLAPEASSPGDPQRKSSWVPQTGCPGLATHSAGAAEARAWAPQLCLSPPVWLQPGCLPFLSHSCVMCKMETSIQGGRRLNEVKQVMHRERPPKCSINISYYCSGCSSPAVLEVAGPVP